MLLLRCLQDPAQAWQKCLCWVDLLCDPSLPSPPPGGPQRQLHPSLLPGILPLRFLPTSPLFLAGGGLTRLQSQLLGLGQKMVFLTQVNMFLQETHWDQILDTGEIQGGI